MASASDYIFTDFSEATCDLSKPLIVNDPGRELRGHDVVWIWEACAELMKTWYWGGSVTPYKFSKALDAQMLDWAVFHWMFLFPEGGDQGYYKEPELPIATDSWDDVFDWFEDGYQETRMQFYNARPSYGDPLQWRFVHDFMAELRRLHAAGLRVAWRVYDTNWIVPYNTETIFPLYGYYAESEYYLKLDERSVYAHHVCVSSTFEDDSERYFKGRGGEVKHIATDGVWSDAQNEYNPLDYYIPQQSISGMKTYAILRVRKNVAKYWSNSPDVPSSYACVAVQIDGGRKEIRLGCGINRLLEWIAAATGIVDDLVHPLSTDAEVEAANNYLDAYRDGTLTEDQPSFIGGASLFEITVSGIALTFAPLERVMAIS